VGDAARTCHARQRPRVGAVLLYHRVSTEPGFDGELVPRVAAADFDAQIALLRRRYAPVDLADLPRAVRGRRRGGRVPVAITFDDDLPEHLDVAAPRLRDRGLPATFFLNGAALDEHPPRWWWDELQAAAAAGADLRRAVPSGHAQPAQASPQRIAEILKRASRAEREAAISRLRPRPGGGAAPLSPALGRDAIAALARDFAIGFHTARHELLTGLEEAELRAALRDGREELELVANRPLTAIAYPHGGADERVATTAREAGFALGVTTQPTCLTETTDLLLVGRVEPGDVSRGRFAHYVERALRRST